MTHDTTKYEQRIQQRSRWHYYVGLIARYRSHLKHQRAIRIARRRGATIGEAVVMPISLAKKANENLVVGNHVSIQTDQLDLRNKITIGNYVIIGAGTEIITESHNIDSPEWEVKKYGLVIEDYVWLPTKVLVLPSCRRIGKGAVVGAGSVVVKDVDEMSVVSGNPAKEFRKRKCVHNELVVESLRAGDYKIYKEARKKK